MPWSNSLPRHLWFMPAFMLTPKVMQYHHHWVQTIPYLHCSNISLLTFIWPWNIFNQAFEYQGCCLWTFIEPIEPIESIENIETTHTYSVCVLTLSCIHLHAMSTCIHSSETDAPVRSSVMALSSMSCAVLSSLSPDHTLLTFFQHLYCSMI